MMSLDMQKLHNPRVAQWLLRIGLAFVFAYAGFDSIREPLAWTGYLPHIVATSSHATAIMRLFGGFELALAVVMLVGVYLRYASALAAVMLLGIVVMNPDSLLITFRDVGLALMAAALAFES
jgi:uncharacterized membrane protein YphA (DoxX/SURF4 family)